MSLILTSFLNYPTAKILSHKSKKSASSSVKATANINAPHIAMVFVQGGSFKMGSDTVYNAQKPHLVTLSNFYIGKYEVTQTQWLAVMGTNPSRFSDCTECPVEKVSYDAAQEYISKLNKITGKTYRLPTEAEWEYAARGGNKSKNYVYSGSNNIKDVGWYVDNADYFTHPIGQKLPNELGIYDMTGNAMEWCQDWYDAAYYASSPVENPQGPSTGTERVLRGGSFLFEASTNLVAYRTYKISTYTHGGIGFRLVLVP